MGGRKCGNTNRGKALSAVKASIPEIYRGKLAKEKTRAGSACVVDGAVLTCFQALPSSLTLSARVSRTVQLQMIWAGLAEQPVTRARMGTLSARVKLAARSLLVGGAGCLALDQNSALSLTQRRASLKDRMLCTENGTSSPSTWLADFPIFDTGFKFLSPDSQSWLGGEMCPRILGTGKLRSLVSYSKVCLSIYILGPYP